VDDRLSNAGEIDLGRDLRVARLLKSVTPLLETAMGAPVGRTVGGNVGAVFLTGLLLLAAQGSPASAADPQGVWLTEDKDAALTIATCGSRLCGRIIWLESATGRGGSLRKDQQNPDPAKRTQGICGLLVINDLASSGPNTWGECLQSGGWKDLQRQHQSCGLHGFADLREEPDLDARE
jgi:hypothetical protein